MTEHRVPVLIVGGGLTGLSSALFQAWNGVPNLLVERHPDLLIHPRARGFTPRTVELYRQVGLEPAIRDAAYARSEGFEWVAVRGDTLAGELIRVEEAEDESGWEGATPSSFAPIDQDQLERLIRSRAEELGAEMRFSTEMTSFSQDETGVTAVIVDRQTGAEQTVRADYLIAADGWASPIRQQLGVATDGPGPFFQVLTLMIEADLRSALRGRRVSIAYLEKPTPGTMLMAHDEVGLRWVFGTGVTPDLRDITGADAEARYIELIRAAAGLPDVPVTIRPQIPGTQIKALTFPIGAQIARQYRSGRVFFVGDAAHVVPPTGGLGANTGIQDAHNLAWKLAAVLKGQAGPALLDSYHAERHPVGALTMQQALARWQTRIGPTGGADAIPLVPYTAVWLGYQYRSAVVLGAPADEAPPLRPAELRGQPGSRAPHQEIVLNGRVISTLDLYGRNFVLLAGTEGDAWVGAAKRIGERLGVPIEAYRFGAELAGPTATDAAVAHGIEPGGALLVRPDGFVAWRSDGASAEPGRVLEDALARLLALQPANR